MSGQGQCDCIACVMQRLFEERYPLGTQQVSTADADKILSVAANVAGVTLCDLQDETLGLFVTAVARARSLARLQPKPGGLH